MMTSFNRKRMVRRVIIHGDCWPVVSATEHVVKVFLPDSQCETTFTLTSLLQQLARFPDAILILCLRPREHIFLFYAIKNELLCHPALVISDELLFSDRVMLYHWGNISVTLHQELTDLVMQIENGKSLYPVKGRLNSFLSYPKPAMGCFTVPLIFNNPKRLMNYMSLLMFRAVESCGVTSDQQKLLKEIYGGRYTFTGLKKVLNRDERKIFQDKNRLLIKLGMRNRLRDLLYGTRFCMTEQRTEFMPPDIVKILFERENIAIQAKDDTKV
ncbi:transcriptional regulator [Salmonella enterica subsp. enterica serovar Javiana]|nr:transcriptional regulator [Salmonella enterica subsp. enterica serovar Javiana]ELD4653129.1 transcriptional regulator [Salmonella enterica subsp. enterica serovar Javiana]